jgi:hypothetical protein
MSSDARDIAEQFVQAGAGEVANVRVEVRLIQLSRAAETGFGALFPGGCSLAGDAENAPAATAPALLRHPSAGAAESPVSASRPPGQRVAEPRGVIIR